MRKAYILLAIAGILHHHDMNAQSRADRRVARQLKEDITYLASDELEGRRVGSEGERKAATYIERRYKDLNIPGYRGKYQHEFLYIDGKSIEDATQIKLANDLLRIKDEAFPLAFSANKKAYGEVIPDVFEAGNIWLMSMYTDKEEAADAHFDWEKKAYERAREAEKQGATGVLFYDNFNSKYAPQYNGKSEYEVLGIPVGFLNFNAYQAYTPKFKDRNELPVEINVLLKRSDLTGHNVTAFIDNGAKYTVVLGAHYDHLGFGHDGNSLYAAKDGKVHNGADDNASGTAGLMQLAEWIKRNKLRNYNYLFISFSGEEEGLIGSKAIVRDMVFDSNKIAYMVNMDMIGRLNDSTHALTIGGVGTSPSWAQFTKPKDFKISVDSSGAGPSDHTSFYRAGIPVLFVFTGLHTDYHKPSDDADKINYDGETRVLRYVYDVVAQMDKQPKPEFRTTKEAAVGKVRFKVTLGIMPDYSFQEGGVRVDGVTDGKPAKSAGLQAGDVIIQLGSHKVNGMQTYMEALAAFKEGDQTEVTIIRGEEEIKLPIEFK